MCADRVKDYQEALNIIKKYNDIIKKKNKGT